MLNIQLNFLDNHLNSLACATDNFGIGDTNAVPLRRHDEPSQGEQRATKSKKSYQKEEN